MDTEELGTTPEGVEPEGKEVDYKAEYERLKAEARKWEGRSKSNLADKNAEAEKAKKWEEYVNSQKSDAEKLAEQLANAQKEAESARVTLAKYRVAAEKGISIEALDFIHGSTDEEIAANADKFLSIIGTSSTTKTVQPTKTQGVDSSTDTLPSDPREAVRIANMQN